MLAAGIVDPAKVVRAALQGAASVAGLLVSTEAMIAAFDPPQADPLHGLDPSAISKNSVLVANSLGLDHTNLVWEELWDALLALLRKFNKITMLDQVSGGGREPKNKPSLMRGPGRHVRL